MEVIRSLWAWEEGVKHRKAKGKNVNLHHLNQKSAGSNVKKRQEAGGGEESILEDTKKYE